MKIVTMGELLIDLTQIGEGDGVPVYAANPGGAPANVAVAASLSGADAAFIGKVGNDAFGEQLINTLKSKNVDISGIIKDNERRTTLATVSLDEKGERSFAFYRSGCADINMSADELSYALIEKADIFHFGSVSLTDEPSASATRQAVIHAKNSGAIITYDPNYRPLLWPNEETAKAEMHDVLKYVDIIKASDEEAFMLTDTKDAESAAKALLKIGIKIVLVTLGDKGAYFASENACGSVDAFTGKVADTNGAGDTFFGNFLARADNLNSLCKNTDGALENAVRFACAAAGLSTGRSGAIPSMPTKAETEAFMNSYVK